MKMAQTNPPHEEILENLKGAQDNFQITGVDLLLAIYQRPEKTAGGIILTDIAKGEDLYQGKVGLILKVGPLVNDQNKDLFLWFGGKLPKVGDWAVVRVGDTYAFNLNNTPCRLVEAKQIRGTVSEPDLVW